MYRSAAIGLTVITIVISFMLVPGCAGPKKSAEQPKQQPAPTYTIAGHFTPGITDTYEVGITVTKDFKFEQPALNKLRQEETTTDVRMIFDQAIKNIDDDGWAVADIAIRGLACKMIKQNEVQIDYDSSRQADQTNPLQKLVGQSYTVRLSPDGRAEVLDAGGINTAGIPALEGRLAKRLFTEEEIIKRHEVLALPDQPAAISPGSTWQRVVLSPPGLLSSKSFQKVYTLAEVKPLQTGHTALITMTAAESAVPAENAAAGQGGLGIFAKMLDNEDEYTGMLEMDIDNGKVLNYNETLISSYIAQEPNPNATPEQGPDTLVIRFIQRVDRKLMN